MIHVFNFNFYFYIRIDRSVSSTCVAPLAITQDTEKLLYIQNTSFNSSVSSGSSDNAERTSLLNGSINQSKPIVKSSTSDSEVITFADIPMPGLWEHDEAGRNTDRIIILLFILLASVVVVSY